MIHISQFSEEHAEKASDVLKIGQNVKARVIKIDPIERRIGLSIKAVNLPDEEFIVKEDMLAGLKPGEDLVDLSGAFDKAFGTTSGVQEWRPGESQKKSEPDEKNNEKGDKSSA